MPTLQLVFLVLFAATWLIGGNIVVALHYRRIGKPMWSGFVPFAFPFRRFNAREWAQLLALAILSLTFAFLSTSGVAGASRDSDKDLAEVKSYAGYIAPQLSETVLQNPCDPSTDAQTGISQHFADIFRSFSFTVERLEGTPVTLSDTGLVATFRDHELLVTKAEVAIIRERLPSVFVMHPMRAGIDTLNGTRVLMVANKSRASTGRSFVAIYALDGTPLYKNVLNAWQIWDIAREDSHIDILGCSETRRITFAKPKQAAAGEVTVGGRLAL